MSKPEFSKKPFLVEKIKLKYLETKTDYEKNYAVFQLDNKTADLIENKLQLYGGVCREWDGKIIIRCAAQHCSGINMEVSAENPIEAQVSFKSYVSNGKKKAFVDSVKVINVAPAI